MQGQPAKIPTYQPPQKRQQWQAKSEVKQGFICFNCQNERYIAKDCNMPTRCDNCKRNGHIWKECPSIKCAKYGKKGYVVKNYHSEKINWLEDIVEPLQILKRPTKQSENVELVAPLKRATFRHPVEQQDPFDVVETLWRTPTNMTFGQLLQDDTYRAEM